MALGDTVKTLQQLYDTEAGTEPWYLEYQDIISFLASHAADISALSGGGTPAFGGPIDLRWYLADTASSGTTYTGSPANLPSGSDTVTTGQFYFFVPATTNTGAATLNIGTVEGAIDFNKIVDGVKSALSAGDLVALSPTFIIYDGSDWIVNLNAPTNVDLAKKSLGLHGTIINTQYDLTAIESASEYTPGYAGGAEFYVRFINEAGTDATIDVHVDDGTTDLQIGDDLPIAANGGIILGPFIFTNVASISAAQTAGNVRMSINGVGYASGDYLTPLTNVEAINSTEETVFTTGSNGGAYKFLLGNNHTADLTGYILAGSTYLTAINHSVAVNNWWLSDLVKIDGSTALKAKTDTTADGFTLLSMGWEV